jgi:chaperonin GroEL
MKQNLKNEDARKAILAGMAEVADIVGATLGPRGQTVILDRPFGAPLVTKDGVTVAKQIAVPDVFENAGAKLIQEVAQKTNMEAGDGTTAATILTHAIFREGVKVVAAGANSMAIERGIHRAVATVVAQLAVLAQPIAKDQIDAIRHIATIAANGDKEMGDVIARAVHRTGIEGVCRVDTSPTIETTVDFTEGLQFERGLLAPYFMTDPGRGVAIHENCNIFVTDRRMIDQKQMAAFLELYGQIAGRAPLLIVAEDIAEGALQVLAVNSPPARASKNLPQIAPICPVRCPGSGATKKEEIEDIAIFCGARAYTLNTGDQFTALRLEDLGSADRVEITPYRTTIIGGHGAAIRLETRKDEIRSRIAEPTVKEFEKTELERRLALLSTSVAVIKIGSSVHSKLLEKRDRVEDSVNATRAALKEGIVPGGGTALIRCLPALDDLIAEVDGDERTGARIVAQALTAPLHRLASNAGRSGDLIVGEVVAMNSPESWIRGHGFIEDEARLLDPTLNVAQWGYNAATDHFEDLIESGIIDPAKVVRLALQNSAELAGLLLTSAALVVDLPEPQSAVQPRP